MPTTTSTTRSRHSGSETSPTLGTSGPAESTTATSSSSLQRTLPGFDSAISSPESAGGHTRSVSRDGPTRPKSGPVPARVSRSRQRDVGGALPMNDIFGPSSSGSSASAVLQSSLESRLRVWMGSNGSTLFRLTWKAWATPLLRRIYARQGSVRRNSGSGFSSWPSPVVNDSKNSDYAYSQGDHSRPVLKLPGAAKLAAWPTSRAQDGAKGSTLHRPNGRNTGLDLPTIAGRAAPWPAAKSADADRGGDARRFHGEQSQNGRRSNLVDAVMTAAPWATPTTRDWRDGRTSTETMDRNSHPLNEQAVAFLGTTPNGSTAPTTSIAQLNPAHSRWLQGYPSAWDEASPHYEEWQSVHARIASGDCGGTATPSSPKSRRGSSARGSKRSKGGE
jgi:hypothetical protein